MPKSFISTEDKQISDIQRYVIGTRKMLRISQDSMATAIGITRPTYNEKERDMASMRLGDFLIALHELGLDLEVKEQT